MGARGNSSQKGGVSVSRELCEFGSYFTKIRRGELGSAILQLGVPSVQAFEQKRD